MVRNIFVEMKVTTKRGDKGTTELFGGKKVSKNHQLIELLGLCDEIQALLGVLKIELNNKSVQNFITVLQKQIYLIMAEISGAKEVAEKKVKLWADNIEAQEQKLLETTQIDNKFIIPGETREEAWCQFVRTRIRALERLFCANVKNNKNFAKFIPYFNRLSDYFFILGRALL